MSEVCEIHIIMCIKYFVIKIKKIAVQWRRSACRPPLLYNRHGCTTTGRVYNRTEKNGFANNASNRNSNFVQFFVRYRMYSCVMAGRKTHTNRVRLRNVGAKPRLNRGAKGTIVHNDNIL